ncbi:MAG TPA: glycosyltransferase family 4 protein [Candidatus Polarisedimenticolia bacterium]|nr:glycosyltransferase family 4 protein [Candidatus Polarisedimenticolia bacterium]
MLPREPRVVFLNQIYPPAFGGGGQYLALIRKAATRAGIPSLVVTGNRGIPGSGDPDVIRLPTPGGERLPRLGEYCFALLSPFVLFALRRRYDLIHTMGSAHSVYGAILMGRLLGKPVAVASVQNRGDDPAGILPQRFGHLKNGIFSRASRFICCSGLQLDTYRTAGYPALKVRFIPNGCDPERFVPSPSDEAKASLRSRLGIPPEGFVTVTLGAIIERKGIDLLAQAWARFRAGRKDGTLVLVGPNRSSDAGSGVEDAFVDSIRARLAQAGVADSVIFAGKVSNVPEYLQAADAFALMSRGEGFPVAILEAMSAGIPFLLWDLPDYGGYDLKDRVHGFFIPPFDTQLLTGRLSELAADRVARGRMGEEARLLAARFSLERSMADHLALYREMVGE